MISKMLNVVWELLRQNYKLLKYKYLFDRYRIFLRKSDGEYLNFKKQMLSTPRYKEGYVIYDKLKIKYVDSASLLSGIYSIFIEQSYKWRFCVPPKTIIDCGCNIGLSALYFKRAHPSCKIICFEPDKKLVEIAKENVNANNFTNVIFHACALGTEEKKALYYSDGADGGRVILNDINREHYDKIDVVRLSNYITEPIDLLKMDIEGSETDVLKEIEGKLYLVDRVVLEYHCFDLRRQTLHDILQLLTNNKFYYGIENVEESARLHKNHYNNKKNIIVIRAIKNKLIEKV